MDEDNWMEERKLEMQNIRESKEEIVKKIIGEEKKIGDSSILDKVEKEGERDRIIEESLKVYNKIIELNKRYCDVREEYAHLVAIWIIGTYVHGCFETFPYLFINAMRGSGKTRMLKFIARLSRNGELLTSLREAVLFRTAKDHTLCIDEFEGLNKKENAPLRELLNACYKKGMKVKRMRKVKGLQGEEQKVEEFEPYTAICLANIYGMEEVLGDRCITFILEKSRKLEITKKLEDFEKNPDFIALKSLLEGLGVVWCSYFGVDGIQSHWNSWVDLHYTLTTLTTQSTLTTSEISLFERIDKTGINGRNLELMFPLIIISHFLGEATLSRTLEIATNITKEKKEDEFIESRDVSLYDFIAHKGLDEDYIPIKQLTMGFRNYLGDDEDEERWLNTKWMGRSLRRLNLILDHRRLKEGVEVRINIEKAIEQLKLFQSDKK